MNKDIKNAVILAAGSGTRLGYLGHLLPKTLFPIYDRPIIHHIIDLLEKTGIENAFIVVKYHKEKIFEYFKNINSSLKINIDFINQEKLDGTANAIALTKKYNKNNDFLTILGDEYFTHKDLNPMFELFYKKDAIAAEAVIEETNIESLRQTCCADIENDGRIIEIIEKPKEPKHRYRGCGIYMFKPEIFEYIKNTEEDPFRKEKDITTVINNVAKDMKAYAYMLDGFHININNYEELYNATKLIRKYSR
jgi:dTDP-glucose pyrophosphorylase